MLLNDEPAQWFSILEVFGTVASTGEFTGEGAFFFEEVDAMGVWQERCVIEFTVSHLSNPTDCTACTAAYEIAFNDVNVGIDQDGGCMASGFDQNILTMPMKWGIEGEMLDLALDLVVEALRP